MKFKEFSDIEENELSKDVKFASEMNQASEPTLLEHLLIFLVCIELYKMIWRFYLVGLWIIQFYPKCFFMVLIKYELQKLKLEFTIMFYQIVKKYNLLLNNNK